MRDPGATRTTFRTFVAFFVTGAGGPSSVGWAVGYTRFLECVYAPSALSYKGGYY